MAKRRAGDHDFDTAPFVVDTSDPDEQVPVNHTNDSFYHERMTANRGDRTMATAARRRRLTADTIGVRNEQRIAGMATDLAANILRRGATDGEWTDVAKELRRGLGARAIARIYATRLRVARELGEEPFPLEMEAEESVPIDGEQPMDFTDSQAVTTLQESRPDRAVTRAIVKEGEPIRSPTAGKAVKPTVKTAGTPPVPPQSSEESDTDVMDPEAVESDDDTHVEDDEASEEMSGEEAEDDEEDDLGDDEEDDEDDDFDDEDDEDADEGLDGVLTDKPTASRRKPRRKTAKSFTPSQWRFASREPQDEWAGFLAESIPNIPDDYRSDNPW